MCAGYRPTEETAVSSIWRSGFREDFLRLTTEMLYRHTSQVSYIFAYWKIHDNKHKNSTKNHVVY